MKTIEKIDPKKMYTHINYEEPMYGHQWIKQGLKYDTWLVEYKSKTWLLFVSAICFLSAILLIIKMLYFM